MELHKKYRPKTFKSVVGQAPAVSVLRDYLGNGTLPHALLFSGPSGCGKTTLARIVASALGCSSPYDLTELNASETRGIDTVREIGERCTTLPLSGPCRVWIVDECHKMTADAQSAFLKILEEPPSHVYFVLCTTDPQKLLKTVVNRCTRFHLSPVSPEEMEALVKRVASKEGVELSEGVLESLVKAADGSPRVALVLLDKIATVQGDAERLAVLDRDNPEKVAIDLARALFQPRPAWPAVAGILKTIDDDPEKVRRVVLGYATSVLLGGGKLAGRASQVIVAFEGHFFDSGRAGLVRACYDLVCSP